MNMINQLCKLAGFGLLISITLMSGCTKEDTSQSKEVTAKQVEHLKEMEALKQKRLATLQRMKQINIPELVEQMEQDAGKGREPFNSPAYREVTRNRKAEGANLLQEITKRKKVSYVTLLALRSVDAAGYGKLDQNLRLEILLDEFSRTTSYNKWGIPHLYWEDAAKAVIEIGKPAIPGLTKFLQDVQPAPVWGSEEVLVYEKYKYRRCDYALAMIMAIGDEKIKELPVSPEARDDMIKQYLGKSP